LGLLKEAGEKKKGKRNVILNEGKGKHVLHLKLLVRGERSLIYLGKLKKQAVMEREVETLVEKTGDRNRTFIGHPTLKQVKEEGEKDMDYRE